MDGQQPNLQPRPGGSMCGPSPGAATLRDRWLTRSRTPRQTSWIRVAAVLDEMLEAGTDNGLQPTPLPNKKVSLTCHFMNSTVASCVRYGFTAAPAGPGVRRLHS